MRESWLSAFSVGWVIAETGRTLLGAAADPWQRELADTALRTMAAGPFRRVLAPGLLDEWAEQAVPLLRIALEQAQSWAASTMTSLPRGSPADPPPGTIVCRSDGRLRRPAAEKGVP